MIDKRSPNELGTLGGAVPRNRNFGVRPSATDSMEYSQSKYYYDNQTSVDNSAAYVPGMNLLMDELNDVAQIDQISHFSRTPVSSPQNSDTNSGPSARHLTEVAAANPLLTRREDLSAAHR